jgi:two-component sensor histidine kinase
MLLLSQVLTENRQGHLAADEVDAAQVINKAGRELLVIIDDILDLTKAEAGRLELYPEDIEVADLAESLTALYRPLAARRQLDLRVTVAPGAPTSCRTDPTRLSQILKNLLNNALKFTERGSVSLDISAAPETLDGQPALDFVIVDSGIGISAEVLPALFAAFTQGDGSIARRFGGSGLGLSICRKLSELLGARILVASEVGRGSTFTLRLPVAFPVSAGQELPPATVSICPPVAALPLSPESLLALDEPLPRLTGAAGVAGVLAGQPILIADGDMRAVYRLTATLEAAGARVRVARDAAAGLARLAEMKTRGLMLVRPQLLDGLPPHERRLWWIAAASAGAGLVVLSSTIPAPTEAPAGLPVVDPDAPDALICRILGGLAISAGNRDAAFAEVGS